MDITKSIPLARASLQGINIPEKKQPLISVLMPVFNAEKYLKSAITSILTQTYKNLELFVINDCSNDGSMKIISSFNDHRVKIISNSRNRGISFSLNKGIDASKGKYIARMDADDISHPDRLKIQIRFMERFPQIGLLGTAYHLINKNGKKLSTFRYPINSIDLKWKLLSGPIFPHPTVMIRKDLLVNHNLKYNEELDCAQDYDLWCRLLNFTDGSNLVKPLIQYRKHPKSISFSKRIQQQRNKFKISINLILDLFHDFPITPNHAWIFRKIIQNKLDILNTKQLDQGFCLFKNALNKFEKNHNYSKKSVYWKNKIFYDYFLSFTDYVESWILKINQREDNNYLKIFQLKIIILIIRSLMKRKRNSSQFALVQFLHFISLRVILHFESVK